MPYDDTINTRKIKKNLKQFNGIYQKHKLVIEAEDITIRNSTKSKKKIKKVTNFIDELYLNHLNNKIILEELTATVNTNNINSINYLKKVNNINNPISVKVKEERENKYREIIPTPLRLLMGISEDECINNKINENRSVLKTDSTIDIFIKKIKFTINQKSLFRVFSRGQWTMHGRFYGGF